MRPYKGLPADLSSRFVDAMFSGIQGFPIADWVRDRHSDPRPLTRAERIQGLAALWMEAEYSFAFWENLPNLDWDAAFQEYLPRVEAEPDAAGYYRILRQFVCLLRDGHSYVIPPSWVAANEAPPRLAVRPLAGEVVVVGGELPPGTVIEAVDGQPVADCLRRLEPLQYASTPHDRLAKAIRSMLRGPAGSVLRLDIRRPGSPPETCELVRSGPLPAPPLLERVDLDRGAVLVRINSWADSVVVDEFDRAFPDFTGITSLIIDLRRNGGGNSENGAAVLARLIDRPVPGTVSRTPLHWGAMSAVNLHRPVLVTSDRRRRAWGDLRHPHHLRGWNTLRRRGRAPRPPGRPDPVRVDRRQGRGA